MGGHAVINAGAPRWRRRRILRAIPGGRRNAAAAADSRVHKVTPQRREAATMVYPGAVDLIRSSLYRHMILAGVTLHYFWFLSFSQLHPLLTLDRSHPDDPLSHSHGTLSFQRSETSQGGSHSIAFMHLISTTTPPPTVGHAWRRSRVSSQLTGAREERHCRGLDRHHWPRGCNLLAYEPQSKMLCRMARRGVEGLWRDRAGDFTF